MLRELAPEVPNLEVRGDGVFATFKFPVPVNQYGVTLRDTLILTAISAANGKTNWLGWSDDHHLNHSEAKFLRVINGKGEEVGRKFRGLASQRFWGPRQMHEYLHVGFDEPDEQEIEVMEQMIIEEQHQGVLLSILNQRSKGERSLDTVDPVLEKERYERYLRQLEHTPDGQIGHMPDREYLYCLDADRARREIGHRVRQLSFNDVLVMLEDESYGDLQLR